MNKTKKFIVTDPDNFLEVLEGVVEERHAKLMPLRHLANILALVSDEIITNYDSIAESYAEQTGDFALAFKAKLNQKQTVVDLAFKPTADFKDSGSLPLGEEDDPDQSRFEEAPVDPEKGARGGTVMSLPGPEVEVEGEEVPALPSGEGDVVDEDLNFEDGDDESPAPVPA